MPKEFRKHTNPATEHRTSNNLGKYYDSVHQEIELTWSKYFHYGIFPNDKVSFEVAQENTLHHIANEARVIQYSTVLDLGCGIGSSSIYLAKNYSVRMLGIDPSVAQIAEAKRRAALEGVHHAQFYVGHSESIPLPEQSIDTVIATEVFCHINNKSGALCEIRRVLKKRGLFIMTDLFDQSLEKSTLIFHQNLQHSTPMPSLAQYRELFEASGFMLEQLFDYSYQLKNNYEAVLRQIHKNKAIIICKIGEAKFTEIQNFYELALLLATSGEIGWSMYTLRASDR